MLGLRPIIGLHPVAQGDEQALQLNGDGGRGGGKRRLPVSLPTAAAAGCPRVGGCAPGPPCEDDLPEFWRHEERLQHRRQADETACVRGTAQHGAGGVAGAERTQALGQASDRSGLARVPQCNRAQCAQGVGVARLSRDGLPVHVAVDWADPQPLLVSHARLEQAGRVHARVIQSVPLAVAAAAPRVGVAQLKCAGHQPGLQRHSLVQRHQHRVGGQSDAEPAGGADERSVAHDEREHLGRPVGRGRQHGEGGGQCTVGLATEIHRRARPDEP
eukprot:scaffold20139_cov103-Isochrysis_galbana.AAC.3